MGYRAAGGERDLLAIRGAARPADRRIRTDAVTWQVTHVLDSKAGDQPWQWQEMPAGLGLATRGETSQATVKAIGSFAKRHGPLIERLSLHALSRA